MNFSIFLISISFLQLVLCKKDNYTEDDSCNICTLSFFRRKRAHTEYTRWRANPDTSPEFIVKVLEDDSPLPLSKQITAVNIQPFTKAHEKIIIGGALVPLTSTETLVDPSKEYTRFVPPTTKALTRTDNNKIFPPIKPILDLPPIRPQASSKSRFGSGRHSQRDESPPASPQFLPRSQTLVARQYAPIAPVVFTKSNTVGPLTPRTMDKYMFRKTTLHPTRTSLFQEVLPLRTSRKFLIEFNSEINNKLPSRSKSPSMVGLERTLFSESMLEREENVPPTKSYANADSRKKYLEKKVEKEFDMSHNNLFSNYDDDDDDSDITTKRHKSFTDRDEENDKENVKIDNSIIDSFENEYVDSENNTKTSQPQINYDDEDESDKPTVNKTVRTLATLTTVNDLKSTKPAIHKKKCSVLKLRPLTFSSPQNLHEIVTQLRKWAEESPIVRWMDITKGNYTVMENPIYMMIVDDPSSGQIVSAKQTVMIVAGIQGRDHHAVAAAMYVLYQLIERSDAHSEILTKYRFWIIPVFNPDGYDYSMTFPHRKEWSKNLRQTWDSCQGRESCQACEEFGLRCTIQPCYGVNLDRNFEYQWIPGEELRAEHPCGALHAGARQLSEAETHALTRHLHDQRAPLATFIAFKEGDVLGIMYPYSHTRKKRAFDHVYRQRASRAASAAYSISGRPYVAGQTSEFLPLYAGGIEDWVDGHLGIDNTFTVMMFRPTDSQNSRVVTERVVHEAYAAVDTLLLQSMEPLGPPGVMVTRAKSTLIMPSKVLASIIILIVLLGYG